MDTQAVLRERLNKIVKELIATCRALSDPDVAIYDGWSAKDILGHLTFWHESFARNVNDLVHDRTPTPLKGRLGDLNQRGVDALRPCSLEEVIGRLKSAQRIIHANILNPKLILIPYRKDSRDYAPEEHLRIVADHIGVHLTAIQRKGRGLVMKAVSQKMGVKAGMRAFLVNAPPSALKALNLPSLELGSELQGEFDYLHVFTITQAELDALVPTLKRHLKPGGMLWVSWPKGKQLNTDLVLDRVVHLGYRHGLVESICLSVDAIWSGIKFTQPKKGKVYRNRHGQLPPATEMP